MLGAVEAGKHAYSAGQECVGRIADDSTYMVVVVQLRLKNHPVQVGSSLSCVD
jgi:hypothetical protein